MYIIYTYYIFYMQRAQPGKNCRWPGSEQQSMQQKYKNKTKTNKNEIKPQHFRLEWVKSEAKRKQTKTSAQNKA